jgi:hypothetical protein
MAQSTGLFAAGMLGLMQLVEAEHRREIEARHGRRRQQQPPQQQQDQSMDVGWGGGGGAALQEGGQAGQ